MRKLESILQSRQELRRPARPQVSAKLALSASWGAVFALSAALSLPGCSRLAKSKTKLTVPPAYQQARTASLGDLTDLVNRRYGMVHSLTVSRLDVEFQGGSAELGFIEKYPHAKGYLLAVWPSSIYVNILNPLTNSTVLTMAAQGRDFQIWAPRENKFVVGTTDFELQPEKPMFNVRPQHLLSAVLIEKIPGDASVFLEEDQDPSFKYYVVGVLLPGEPSQRLCLTRRLWIERSTLRLSRQQYYQCGALVSTIRYRAPVEIGEALVSTQVALDRMLEHYRIHLELDQEGLAVNRELKPERFEIPRPPGAELVKAGEERQ